MKNFAQLKLHSLANQVCLMCVVCFSLAGCSKYEQQPVAIDVAYHLHGVWARDAAQVWVVGDAGEILRSTDGGEHWQQQRSGTEAELISIHGSDSQLWIVGAAGTILHSTDGGEHWQLQTRSVTHHLLAVCCVGSELWTVGYGGVILHSTDGGRIWRRQTAEGLTSG